MELQVHEAKFTAKDFKYDELHEDEKDKMKFIESYNEARNGP